MAKSKKSKQSKPSVKVQDISPKKTVKGGKPAATGDHFKSAIITT